MALTPEQIAQMDKLAGGSALTEQDVQRMDRLTGYSPQPTEPARHLDTMGRIGAAVTGALDTATLGFGDEALAYVRSLMNSGVSYEDALAQARGRMGTFQESAPGTYLGGQIAGAFAPAAGAAGAITRGAQNVLRTKPLLGAAGIGAVEGGLYGFGAGEGGAVPRLEEAGTGAAIGGVGGVAGAGAFQYGKNLLDRAKRIFSPEESVAKIVPGTPEQVVEEIATKSDELMAADPSLKAIQKVEKALVEDLGEEFDVALEAYKKGDSSLAEFYGNRSKALAKGAAQYPGGQSRAEEFFSKKTEGSYERILDSINNKVTDLDAYFANADDLFNIGRKKASPLYKQAYESIADVEIAPEVSQAIKRARRQYPSELADLPDNSVKTLDYAKRVIDDEIGAAQRAGRSNLARSRTNIKNDLLSKIDEKVPSYAEARAVSGDYLSIQSAIENGRDALKKSPEDVSAVFKGLSEPEKIAFRNGMGKEIREQVSKVAEGVNPYKRILGSPEKRKRIEAVLSPAQFKELDRTLRAEDRLFKMRNEVLGGSPTASKLEAKNLISTTTQGVDNALQVPRKTMTETLNTFFDGLNDKTASKVSEILYETDPQKKLKIIDALGKSKDFSPAERKVVKETYFSVMPAFDVTRAIGAGVGGISSLAMMEDQ